MRKIKYKEISPEMDLLARPGNSSRIAIGMDKKIGEFYFLPIDDLIPFENQARKVFSQEEIDALADSIKKHGIRQPLTVVSSENQKGKYEVISGERRLKAANLAGLPKVPCIILKEREKADEVALIENVHRQDLHPIELGLALKALLDKKVFYTQSEMAKNLFLKESVVSECLKLADIDEDTQKYLLENGIKSRDLLRRIAINPKNKDEIEKILGKKGKFRENFSVMRIRLVDDKFNLQLKGIEKLDEKQKKVLRKELDKVLQSL